MTNDKMTNDKKTLITLINNSLKESPIIIDIKNLNSKSEIELNDILKVLTQN